MNNDYVELPENLRILADNYAKPYDKNYNYIADMDIFLKYEKEVKGLTGLSITCFNEDGNYNAYCFLNINYSPDVQKIPMNDVFC